MREIVYMEWNHIYTRWHVLQPVKSRPCLGGAQTSPSNSRKQVTDREESEEEGAAYVLSYWGKRNGGRVRWRVRGSGAKEEWEMRNNQKGRTGMGERGGAVFKKHNSCDLFFCKYFFFWLFFFSFTWIPFGPCEWVTWEAEASQNTENSLEIFGSGFWRSTMFINEIHKEDKD